jgi:hypothetical protein
VESPADARVITTSRYTIYDRLTPVHLKLYEEAEVEFVMCDKMFVFDLLICNPWFGFRAGHMTLVHADGRVLGPDSKNDCPA